MFPGRIPLSKATLLLAIAVVGAVLSSPASAAEEAFSWRQHSGQAIRVMLNKDHYGEAIRHRINDFEALTGIKVAFVMLPEDRYFQRLREALEGGYAKPEVYMTGAYQVWEYALAGHMADLDPYILNPVKTRYGYNVNDFFPAISGAFRWNGKAGAKLGTGPLWAIPVGFSASTLTFNREILAQYRLRPPRSLEELLEVGRTLRHFDGEDTYGVVARGAGEWNSIHSGYISAFVNYGARDMAVENGRLVSKVNSPEAVAMTDLWVRILKECGAPDWEYYDWYRCLQDIGDRRAAMLLDSDTVGYYANSSGTTPQAGKLGMVPPPMPADDASAKPKTNLWVWGLAINPDSPNTAAAWLFVQYFTSREFQTYSVLEWASINPPRRSVYEDPAFRAAMASMDGYFETFSTIIDNIGVYFTPNPYFSDISERWAAVIRDIANGMYSSTQEGMDTLKIWMDNKLADVRVE